MIKGILKKIYHLLIYLPGFVICKFPLLHSYKIHLLSTWLDIKQRRGIDKFLFNSLFNFWIKFEYLREKNPDKREKLKGICMGGNSGREWARIYDSRPLDFNSRIGHLNFREAYPIFDELEGICRNSKDLFIVQIGSSSGREIAYFVNRYPEHKYIGTDIYQEVVDYSSHSHKLENLSFKKLSAKDISRLLPKDKNIVIFSSGSLQYVQPEHIEIFFNSISDYPAKILLLEPGNDSQDNPEKIEGSLWRTNFSYTHNYRYYGEKAKIKTIKCKIIKPYSPGDKGFSIHKNTIHYFYYGKR